MPGKSAPKSEKSLTRAEWFGRWAVGLVGAAVTGVSLETGLSTRLWYAAFETPPAAPEKNYILG
jgi:hypothetical protein